MSTPPRITVRIDELVLHGLPREQRHAVAEAFETELARLCEESGAPLAGGRSEVPRLDLGTLHLSPGTPPSRIGRMVARKLHGGIS